jgi:hypothetical protein
MEVRMNDHGKVEELRREISLIRGWNDRYLLAKYPTNVAREANEHRRERLVQIISELKVFRNAA